MSADRELVRGWVGRNYSTINDIVQQAGNDTNARFELEDNPRRFGPDMFSETLCYEAVNYFPDEKLEFMQKIAWACVKHIDHLSDRFQLRRVQNWKRYGTEIPHWRFHYLGRSGLYVADPTFGQFAHLDESIKAYPELFVGRVLVANAEEIRSFWGIDYEYE